MNLRYRRPISLRRSPFCASNGIRLPSKPEGEKPSGPEEGGAWGGMVGEPEGILKRRIDRVFGEIDVVKIYAEGYFFQEGVLIRDSFQLIAEITAIEQRRIDGQVS